MNGINEKKIMRNAFNLLYIIFIILPISAGADKLFHISETWHQYLSVTFAGLLPFSEHTFMFIVGVIEVLAGIIVAVNPRVGSLIVAAWLGLIIINLLFIGMPVFDVMLRDIGLLLAALTLNQLSRIRSFQATT